MMERASSRSFSRDARRRSIRSLEAGAMFDVETMPKPLGVRIRSSWGTAWSIASAARAMRQW